MMRPVTLSALLFLGIIGPLGSRAQSPPAGTDSPGGVDPGSEVAEEEAALAETVSVASHHGEGLSVDPDRARILAGLPGVYVELVVPSETQDEGVRLLSLQTDILLRFRELGIDMLTLTEVNEIPGRPLLVVRVDAVQDSYGSYAPMVDIFIQEAVSVDRMPGESVQAPTWRTSGFGAGLAPQEVRPFVMSFLEEFAAEFLSVNRP